MHRQEYIYYCFLLLFVEVNCQDIEQSLQIKYTCNGSGVNNITIADGNFSHVEVLTKAAGYCKPSPTNLTTTLACIQKFKDEVIAKSKITEVTILYEDETVNEIVGGKNTKYYQLSCTEKATNKIAVMVPKPIWTTISPEVLHADLTDIPKLKTVPENQQIYVGQEITLEMSVVATHQLLPQVCRAYRDDSDSSPYKFWENCITTDEAITNAKSWTPTSAGEQGIMRIKMFAFRFIETDNLIIKCDTIVCPKKGDPTCDMACVDDNRRRRRDLKNHQQKTNATVSIALKVSDRPIQDNGSIVVSPVLYIYGIGFGIIYWMKAL